MHILVHVDDTIEISCNCRLAYADSSKAGQCFVHLSLSGVTGKSRVMHKIHFLMYEDIWKPVKKLHRLVFVVSACGCSRTLFEIPDIGCLSPLHEMVIFYSDHSRTTSTLEAFLPSCPVRVNFTESTIPVWRIRLGWFVITLLAETVCTVCRALIIIYLWVSNVYGKYYQLGNLVFSRIVVSS